jgi:methyl-coenzyme M reductase alpha subunit
MININFRHGVCRFTNSLSYRSEKGLIGELRGPSYAVDVGHQGGYSGFAGASHIARGDA